MTKTAETGATAPKWWAGKYSSIVGLPICAQPDPKKNSIVVCGVRGTKEEAEEHAALIVRAVNRDSRFGATVRALEEAAIELKNLFAMVQGEVPSLLENHFSWDRITDAIERADVALTNAKAST